MIDLRSDTLTKPCAEMREAMMAAPVGDDVYGEDPTVNRLEHFGAELLGKQAAIFAPSGTQTNLLALLSHCGRGDEYIVGQQAHTYLYEGGGAAVLGSIQPQPLEFEADGSLDLDKVARFIKPDDPHFAITRLLCLENTTGGKILPMEYLSRAREFCDDHGLALHLDGARAFNAAVGLKRPIADIAAPFDSISICLSKGLGAPVGSLLVGSEDLILRARRWRKMLGGGMRQAGILAAAGLYALENNVNRLDQDHKNAKKLASLLSSIDGLEVSAAQTNMVFVTLPENPHNNLVEFMKARGISLSSGTPCRLVTHKDVSSEDMAAVADAFGDYCKG